MARLLRIYTSYFRTAAWAMVFATLFFFFYAVIRTSAPLPSLFSYGVALSLIVALVLFVAITKYVDVMAVDADLRVANIIGSLRMDKKTEQPKSVSIVIPVFNEASLVPVLVAHFSEIVNALRSSESLHSTEVIFVDDGSTDDTYQQLERYSKSLEAIAVIKVLRHSTNKGFAESQRTGFGAAAGELVISFNAQSVLFPTKSGVLSRAWHRPKAAFLDKLKIAGTIARSAFGNLL